MNRRRFLVTAGAASSAGLASLAGFAPRAVLAASANVAAVHVIRWPREMLHGNPGRCAGTRGTGAFDQQRLLSLH